MTQYHPFPSTKQTSSAPASPNLPIYLQKRAGLEATYRQNISGRNPETPAPFGERSLHPGFASKNKKCKIIN